MPGNPWRIRLFFLICSGLLAQEPSVLDISPPFPVLADPPGAASESVSSAGFLQVSIETVREQTPRMRSLTADQVEVWRGDVLLAMVAKGSPRVAEARHRRTFHFPTIPLPPGYHFLTIRVYAEGFLSREFKWKGRTMQVGIQPGRTTYLRKLFPFFVW